MLGFIGGCFVGSFATAIIICLLSMAGTDDE